MIKNKGVASGVGVQRRLGGLMVQVFGNLLERGESALLNKLFMLLEKVRGFIFGMMLGVVIGTFAEFFRLFFVW